MLSQLFKTENIRESNYRYFFANNHAYLIGGFAHVCFIPTFYYLNLTTLTLYNILSVFIFALAFILNRKSYHVLSTVPVSIEIMLHAFLTVYYIGWASGFFYYTLAIIPLVFGSPTISKGSKFYLTLLIAFFYISLKYYSNLHLPLIPLDSAVLHYLYYMNSFFMIVSISALVYYSSLGSQITENKIGNERTKADLANRAKSAFLANISHELRTPLNAIIGYSEMIKDEEEELGHSRNVDDLKKISNAGNHLLSLINNILDLSKIESGKTEMEYQVTNINGLIEEVIATITPLAERRKNTLIVKNESVTGNKCLEPTKTKQILYNLLSNACKFTENGTITLTAVLENNNSQEYLTLTIEDSGIGIPQDKISSLFQPFTQADISTTRLYGGTGLGLTISKHFITLMKGEIELVSEVKKGSTFTVKLPLNDKNCKAIK